MEQLAQIIISVAIHVNVFLVILVQIVNMVLREIYIYFS
jgi:hypothetical protein